MIIKIHLTFQLQDLNAQLIQNVRITLPVFVRNAWIPAPP